MDLTTTARVKTYGGIETTNHDTLIAQLIAEVSSEIEEFLGRKIQDTGSDQTEVLDIEYRDQRVFALRAWPVSSITSVIYEAEGDFANGTTLTSSEFVDISSDPNNRGLLRLRTSLPPEPLSLQVKYQGGMAQDTASLVAAYPDVALACEIQVLMLLQRRHHIGVSSVTGDGGTVTMFERQSMPYQVLHLLKKHRRDIT